MIRYISILIIIGTFFSACSDNTGKLHKRDIVAIDLDSIKSRGKLIAVTDFNSTDYFIYRGEPMGFQFELLQALSDYLGVDVEIVTEKNLDKSFDLLHTGKADLIAIGLTVNSERMKEIHFTNAITETRQVLVQKKPGNWKEIPAQELESRLIRDHAGLSGKTVYVQKSSSHAAHLRSLSRETGASVTIIEVPFESEELIKMVHDGDIELTVCDENVALVNSTYYSDIDVKTPLSQIQNIAWGIRKNHSEQLRKELNTWISSFRKTGTYYTLYSKYFKNSRSGSIIRSDYFANHTGRVSPFDDIIKIYSDTIGWDWRLLASLICQESRFDPSVRSWAGAYGLMQIMPQTGKNFGIDVTASPSNNIYAGARYINWLHSIFDPRVPDANERTRFILAAYNAGPGHILDAMNLAGKYGYNPEVWEKNVREWLQKKSDPRYFNDSVVRSGYFKGRESVAFVDEVLSRYSHYKNIVPENREQVKTH